MATDPYCPRHEAGADYTEECGEVDHGPCRSCGAHDRAAEVDRWRLGGPDDNRWSEPLCRDCASNRIAQRRTAEAQGVLRLLGLCVGCGFEPEVCRCEAPGVVSLGEVA